MKIWYFFAAFASGVLTGTFFWLIEVGLFVIAKLRNPRIWFYLPLRMWVLYALVGAVLSGLVLLACSLFRREEWTTESLWRRFFGGFFAFFLALDLLGAGLLYARVVTLGNRSLSWGQALLLVTLAGLVGLLAAKLLPFRKTTLKKAATVVSCAFLITILLPRVWDINALVFSERPRRDSRADPAKPNLILIVVDALRADHLSCMGNERVSTPSIDRIAREGVLFSNCIVQAPWTLPSFGSIFTSLYPSQHGAEEQWLRITPQSEEKIILKGGVLPSENETLAEILSGQDYTTVAFQPNITAGSTRGFDQGFDFFLDSYKFRELFLEHLASVVSGGRITRMFFPSYVYAPDASITKYALRWLEQNQDLPFYLHALFFDLHEFDLRGKKAESREDLIRKYDSALEKVDAFIARIYDYLAGSGLLDQTALVVLSDHGEELFDHGGTDRGYGMDYDSGQGHAHTLYDELLKIPLIIRFPAKIIPGQRVDHQIRSIDILPTLMSLLDLGDQGPMEGVDLASSRLGPDKDLVAYSESILHGPEKKSIRTGEWKLIFHPQSQRFELYHHGSDPKEIFNLVEREREVFASLRDQLFHWMAETPRVLARRKETRTLSLREREALRSLGYIR